MTPDYATLVPEFSLRNPDLPLLAIEAAIDIDNYMLGRDKEVESVKHLAKLLKDITRGKNPKATRPDVQVVLGQAYCGKESFENFWRGKNTHDLLSHIRLVSEDLGDFPNLPVSAQERLRDFCVGLSNSAAYHYSTYFTS